MSHDRARRALAVVLVLAASLLACELVLRLATRRDDDGQLWLGALRLMPYRLPLDSIRQNLDKLGSGDTFLAWDADLGWSPRPNTRSSTRPFFANGAGIRAEREFDETAPPGTLRIATFGDSFTFGDEVGPDETWQATLERTLAARGITVEVLNFGVSAYGIDQAYLRWRRDGRRFRPDVVLFGFQPENVLRDRNVFRPLYFAGTEVPLSKPRFVVRGEELDLLNGPVLPVDAVLPALETMPAHPLFAYEGFYAPWYVQRWWLASRLAAFVASATVAVDAARFHLDAEGRELAARLVTRFAADVTADGAAFVLVHLPRREDLAAKHAGREPWYAPLLQDLAPLGVVEPTASVASDDAALFAPRGHYAPAMNAIVGAALADPVMRARSTTPSP